MANGGAIILHCTPEGIVQFQMNITITFHVSPFPGNGGDLRIRPVSVSGHQMKDTYAAIPVYEDWFNRTYAVIFYKYIILKEYVLIQLS